MKKLVFAFLLAIAATTSASAQVVVNGININNLEEVSMIRMIAQNRLFSTTVTIYVDYGQSVQGGGSRQKTEVINPHDGKRIRFNSVMHAVNYLISNGWQYVEAMVLPSEGNASTTGSSTQYMFVRQ